MSGFFWIGACLGAVIGLLHMLHVLATRLGQPGLSIAKTLWQVAWIWALWTLFGAYVLAFWILGALLLGVSRLLGNERGAA